MHAMIGNERLNVELAAAYAKVVAAGDRYENEELAAYAFPFQTGYGVLVQDIESGFYLSDGVKVYADKQAAVAYAKKSIGLK